MFKELTTDTLHEEVGQNERTIVLYSATWCGNCRMMKPIFKRIGEEREDVQFILLDAEKNPNSRSLATVDNLPTFAAFKGGHFVQQTQTNKPSVLKEFIDEVTRN